MVMLIAKNTLKPGTEQDFLALAREMTAKTRAEESRLRLRKHCLCFC